jgi:hypothetical protein
MGRRSHEVEHHLTSSIGTGLRPRTVPSRTRVPCRPSRSLPHVLSRCARDRRSGARIRARASAGRATRCRGRSPWMRAGPPPCFWRLADQLRRAALPCFGVATSMFPLSLAPRPALSRLAGRAAAPRPTGRVAKPGKAPTSGRAPESSATVLKGCSSPKESQFHHAPWISMPALRREEPPSPGRPRGSARPGADDGR